ncbi:MAG: hypothetical protein ACPG5T_07880 [Endozoicomonas sp.]
MTGIVLVFDMDGVIADSWDSFHPFCCGFLKDIHQPQLCHPTRILKLFEGNFMASLHKAISPSTLDSGQLQQLAIGLSRLMSEAPCFPEAVKTLKALGGCPRIDSPTAAAAN